MRWIHSPLVDLGLFSFSWIAVFVFVGAWPMFQGVPNCEIFNLDRCSGAVLVMFAVSNYLFRLHRHYTFAVVYGDRDELARHRRLYTYLPLALFALLLPFTLYKLFSGPWYKWLHSGLGIFAGIAGTWSLWHIVMQKYGLIRIYSSRLGYGDAKAEFGLLLSWLVVAGTALVSPYHQFALVYGQLTLGLSFRTLSTFLALASYTVWVALPFAIYYTWRFARVEIKHFSRASIPKLVFVLTSLLMLASIRLSLVDTYIAAGVNHSVEYIAFVNIYGLRKPGLSYWAARPVLSNVLVVGIVAVLFWLFRLDSVLATSLVLGYSTLISFVHFVYDGVLWKLREPPRRESLLAIGTPLPEQLPTG